MKRLAICIALQAALLALCQVSYAQKIIYVNDNSTANDKFTTATGNDSNPGTSASPYASLTKAMAEASSGDRILLDAGTYLTPSLTVKSGVKIIGTAGDNSVVTAQSGPLSLQGNTELWNLKIQRVLPPIGTAPSISVALAAGANNVLIENCYFFKNRTAIYLEPGSTDITIKRNRFNDNRTGIIFPGSAGVTSLSKIYIVDNELINNRSYGFILTENSNSPIEAYLVGNNITGNLAGGLENDNTNGGTKLILRNNWFGSASPTIFNGNTNGGFNVTDHDNPAAPILEANNTLPGVSYPNQISGTNTGAIDNSTVIYADQVQPRPGTVNFVSSNNTNISGHGTFNYFPSIADAISASNTDAIVTLPNGVYSDNVVLNKKLTLTGESRDGAIIRGTYDYGIQGTVITISAADAKIEKLTFTRDYGKSDAVWKAGKRDTGISINAGNVTIDQITVRDQRSAIYAHTQQGFKITNSLVEKNRTGISLGSDISNSIITNNIIRDNFTHGIIFNYAFGSGITATNMKVKYNAFSGNWFTHIYAHGPQPTSIYTDADMSCNTFNTNAAETKVLAAGEPSYADQTPAQFGGSAPAFFASFAGDKIGDLTTAPWLINIPAPGPSEISFVPTNSPLNVDAVAGSFTAANNNYRILANAIGCVQENQTITLNGSFDWTETNAAAEWAKGTNAKAGDGIGTVTGNGDNYSITPPAAVNGVTITSNAGSTTIQGGGDLAVTSLETFLFLNSKTGSSFKNWTVSNLILKGFDVSIIADHVNGPIDVADNMKITGNEFHIPADLNASAAAADNFQNIGIHYVYGKNIEISSNKFFIDGTGVSDDANSKYSVTYAIQSATSGGTAYDGLKIINNEFTVTGAPDATQPAAIKGIWENGHNEGAEITISGNKFTNDTPGNTADKNRQTALWVTSRSGAKNVTYQNNEVTGYSEGIAWLGGSYTGNTPPDYNTGANPVIVSNNIFNATGKGVVVRKSGGSTNTGSPAKINSNSFTGSLTFDIVNEGTGATDASCNWFDGGELVSSTGGGSIVATPKLTNGTDDQPGTTGFQTSAPCEFNVKNVNTNETFATIQAAVDDSDTQDGHEIAIANGTYNERVTLSKSLKLSGESKAGVILDGTGLAGTGSGIVINTGKTGVTIQNLSIKNYTGTSGNSHAGIYAVGGNNNLTVLHVVSSNNTSASGFYANGPVENVTIDDLTAENNGAGARGIVIWNGLKKNITIKNSTVKNNNCCGIELQDGSASGVLIKDNNIEGNDSSIGLVGLTNGAGPNVIEGNTIKVNGRFGIEIKNPNGTGSTDASLDGSIIVRNNTVTMGTLPGSEMRDLAGIAVYRRGVIEANGNVDVPTGVVVTGNTVTGFNQPSTSEGFGIVVEGTNHKVINNPVSGNEVDVQRQSGHLPYTAYSTADGDQGNLTDQFFGRGNAPYSCGIEVSGNTGNPVRDVFYNAVAGFVININTGGTFCSINAAVASAKTLDAHTIKASAGTYAEAVTVNKAVKLIGANAGVNPNTASRGAETIVVPATNNFSDGIIISVDGALTGVEIDGFTIDGDNAAISGGAAMGSADVNAAEGIAATGGVTDMFIKNNIIQNLNYAGVDIYNDTNGGAATSGNTVSGNKFTNLLPSVYGIGVLLYNNGYASVTNNVMTAVRIGIQTGNFSQADPGNSRAIESNTIEASRKGIWQNLTYSNASNFTIKNNTITALAGTTLNDGIMISSTQGTVAPVVENNTITGIAGVSSGYHLWNNPSNAVAIKGGTVSTVLNGVFANNFDGYPDNTGSNAESSAYTVDGVTINAATNGVVVKDNTSNTNNATVKVTLSNSVVIDQPLVYGIQVLGKDAQAVAGSTQIKMTGSTLTAISAASTNGSTVANITLKNGISIDRNGNAFASILFSDDDATVDLDGNFAIPGGGPTYPAIIEGKLTFTSGILDATAAPIAFNTGASDIIHGPKAESSASHILGRAIMLSRVVNTNTVSFLGVDLPSGADLGTLVIERNTSTAAITPALPAGAINVLWTITPGNAGNGRNGVKFSFLEDFLNAQNPGTLYGYRHNGSGWEKKTDAFTASLSGDLYTTSAFNVTQFSPWTLSSSSSPLPVTLIAFDGVKEENSALLTWATSEETNSDRFDIQHSTDGKNWGIVGTLASNGESTVKRTYSFRHDGPIEGQNFYRLKMVDKDETFAYSRIVNLNFGSEVVTTLYPNPVSDHMKINTTNWNQVKQVRIYDMLGRTIYDSGNRPTAMVSLRNVAAGMYLVEISRLNGKVENSKIMVNR